MPEFNLSSLGFGAGGAALLVAVVETIRWISRAKAPEKEPLGLRYVCARVFVAFGCLLMAGGVGMLFADVFHMLDGHSSPHAFPPLSFLSGMVCMGTAAIFQYAKA